MIREWLRTLTVPWFERGRRGALARAIATVGDQATADATRALRQRLPLTADDLGPHERNSMLRRRPGEADRDWRLRLAVAGREMARQGQVGDVRARLDLLLGPGAWEIEEYPRQGFRVGHQAGDSGRPVASAPMLVVITQQPSMQPSMRFRIGDAVGSNRPVGGILPATEAAADLSYLVESLDPDIKINQRSAP